MIGGEGEASLFPFRDDVISEVSSASSIFPLSCGKPIAAARENLSDSFNHKNLVQNQKPQINIA